jgi:hypothetical protein
MSSTGVRLAVAWNTAIRCPCGGTLAASAMVGAYTGTVWQHKLCMFEGH